MKRENRLIMGGFDGFVFAEEMSVRAAGWSGVEDMIVSAGSLFSLVGNGIKAKEMGSDEPLNQSEILLAGREGVTSGGR